MTELAYIERAQNFATTNITWGSTAAASLIGNLSVTTVGTGAPVEVEFYCPSMGHSSNAAVSSYFVATLDTAAPVVNAATSQYLRWATPQYAGGVMRRRIVLTSGVSYTFQVGITAALAGITSAYGSVTQGGITTGTMHLRITG